MNINELHSKLLEKFSDEDLKGELSLNGNCIIWIYYAQNENNSNDNFNQSFNYDDEDDNYDSGAVSGFESMSIEEQLNDTYTEDCEKIELYLDEIEETGNWVFSDADVLDDYISFKIF